MPCVHDRTNAKKMVGTCMEVPATPAMKPKHKSIYRNIAVCPKDMDFTCILRKSTVEYCKGVPISPPYDYAILPISSLRVGVCN